MWGVWIETPAGGKWGARDWLVFATPSRGHAEAQAEAWRRNDAEINPAAMSRYTVREFNE